MSRHASNQTWGGGEVEGEDKGIAYGDCFILGPTLKGVAVCTGRPYYL